MRMNGGQEVENGSFGERSSSHVLCSSRLRNVRQLLVLKHEPWSITTMRACGWQTPPRIERKGDLVSEVSRALARQHRPVLSFGDGSEFEYLCGDPKDGDLLLLRLKAGETLLEGRRRCDVQIHV